MGISVRIALPKSARIYDVANAAASLMGCHRRNIEYTLCSSTLTRITFYGPNGSLVDGEDEHMLSFHNENEYLPSHNLLTVPSTPFWIAVGKGLAKFFGGLVDFNDSDTIAYDYEVAERNNLITNDADFDVFYARLNLIKPLNSDDIGLSQSS
jgi:hypothetical protein